MGTARSFRRTTTITTTAALGLALLTACSTSDPAVGVAAPAAEMPSPTEAAKPLAPAASPTANPWGRPNGVQTVTANLEAPWGLAFLPDGTALVSERNTGRIYSLRPGVRRQVAQLPVVPDGEGGLLGIAVSPSYASDKLVYAYYTAANDNRIVRFRLGAAPQLVLAGIKKASSHNGGRIAFGPDGMLYAGTGDAGNPDLSQNRTSLNGKILRMRPDGGVPAGNPFGSRVWSYGHRNVQGLAWNGQTMYATEFGQNRFDEVNRIRPGGNYGWPIVEGVGNNPRYVDPVVTWQTEVASPSGATFAGGALYVAALRGERLWQVRFPATGAPQTRALFTGRFGRLRHVAKGPDGGLWLLTSNRDGRGEPIATDDRVLRMPLPS